MTVTAAQGQPAERADYGSALGMAPRFDADVAGALAGQMLALSRNFRP